MRLRWKLLFVATGLTCGALSAPLAMRCMIAARIERELGATVDVRSAKLSLQDRILALDGVSVLRGIDIGENKTPSQMLAIDRVLLKFRWQDLLHRNLVLDHVAGEGAQWTLAVPDKLQVPVLEADQVFLLPECNLPTPIAYVATTAQDLADRMRAEQDRLNAKWEVCSKELDRTQSLLGERQKQTELTNPLRELETVAKIERSLTELKQMVAEFRIARRDSDKGLSKSKGDLELEVKQFLQSYLVKSVPQGVDISRALLERGTREELETLRPYFWASTMEFRSQQSREILAATDAVPQPSLWSSKSFFRSLTASRGFDFPGANGSIGITSVERAMIKGIARIGAKNSDAAKGQEFELKYTSSHAGGMPGEFDHQLEVSFIDSANAINGVARSVTEAKTGSQALRADLQHQANNVPQSIFQFEESEQQLRCDSQISMDVIRSTAQLLLSDLQTDSPVRQAIFREIAKLQNNTAPPFFKATVRSSSKPSTLPTDSGSQVIGPSLKLHIEPESLASLETMVTKATSRVVADLQKSTPAQDLSDWNRQTAQIDANWKRVMQQTAQQAADLEKRLEQVSKNVEQLESSSMGRMARRP